MIYHSLTNLCMITRCDDRGHNLMVVSVNSDYKETLVKCDGGGGQSTLSTFSTSCFGDFLNF